MNHTFRTVLAYWFVVQIALPFTAPLQTCDLASLLGTTNHHSSPTSPESTSTPTDSDVFVSPLAASNLKASTLLTTVVDVAMHSPTFAFAMVPAPPVQQPVLRL